MKTLTMRGCGRGGNPGSRLNLAPPVLDAFVYERGAGSGWSKLAGPMSYSNAAKWAARLEGRNSSALKPMYAATRGEL